MLTEHQGASLFYMLYHLERCLLFTISQRLLSKASGKPKIRNNAYFAHPAEGSRRGCLQFLLPVITMMISVENSDKFERRV